MYVIGLCGGSGSGKGTVSDIFSEHGYPAIDTDAVYRYLTSTDTECQRALRREFGDGIIAADGTLDRAALSAIVFGSEEADKKRRTLNTISHKFVLDETDRILDNYNRDGIRLALVDAPLLFESGYNEKCDIVLAVIADSDLRIKRICQRDGITIERAELRIASQITNDELVKKSDYVIENNGSYEELRAAVCGTIQKIRNERGFDI